MRLIDAEHLKWNVGGIECGEITIDYLLWVIDHLPTVDAVPVIRCKDCKWFVRKEFVCYKLSNNYEPSVYVRPDDFCSMADRRDDETD